MRATEQVKLNIICPQDIGGKKAELLNHIGELFSLKAAQVSEKLDISVHQVAETDLVAQAKSLENTRSRNEITLLFMPENKTKSRQAGFEQAKSAHQLNDLVGHYRTKRPGHSLYTVLLSDQSKNAFGDISSNHNLVNSLMTRSTKGKLRLRDDKYEALARVNLDDLETKQDQQDLVSKVLRKVFYDSRNAISKTKLKEKSVAKFHDIADAAQVRLRKNTLPDLHKLFKVYNKLTGEKVLADELLELRRCGINAKTHYKGYLNELDLVSIRLWTEQQKEPIATDALLNKFVEITKRVPKAKQLAQVVYRLELDLADDGFGLKTLAAEMKANESADDAQMRQAKKALWAPIKEIGLKAKELAGFTAPNAVDYYNACIELGHGPVLLDEIKVFARESGIGFAGATTKVLTGVEKTLLEEWLAAQIKEYGSITANEFLSIYMAVIDHKAVLSRNSLDKLVEANELSLARREEQNLIVDRPAIATAVVKKPKYEIQIDEFKSKFEELVKSQPKHIALFNAFVDVYKYIPADTVGALTLQSRSIQAIENDASFAKEEIMSTNDLTPSVLARINAWAAAQISAGKRLSNRELAHMAFHVLEKLPSRTTVNEIVQKCPENVAPYDQDKAIVDLVDEPELSKTDSQVNLRSLLKDLDSEEMDRDQALTWVAEYLRINRATTEVDEGITSLQFDDFCNDRWSPGTDAQRLGLALFALYQEPSNRYGSLLRTEHNWDHFVARLGSSL
ncbi:MAG: hypothetical protein HOA17_03500 [Candidatus Melainabacteria bacterium]|nr:hypothetical protein [Candidatus Melainabacteria bacterium]